MCSLHCLKISVCWRYLKIPPLPYPPQAAQRCWTWSWGRAALPWVTKQAVGFHLLQEPQPLLWCVSATWQGKARVSLSFYFSLNTLNSLFFCCCLCLKGRSQGAGGGPCCSALSLCKEGTVGHKGFLFPHIKLCLYHTEQKHPAGCKLLCVQCQHLSVCAYMCLCFAVPLPLGHFAVHPGVRSYLGCLCLVLSVACTKGPFQWMPSGPWWFLQSYMSVMVLSPMFCPFYSWEMIKNCSQNITFFLLMWVIFWNVSTGSTTEFSSVVISPPGQGKTKGQPLDWEPMD